MFKTSTNVVSGSFTSSSCSGRQRNVPKIVIQMKAYSFARKTSCFFSRRRCGGRACLRSLSTDVK